MSIFIKKPRCYLGLTKETYTPEDLNAIYQKVLAKKKKEKEKENEQM
ncbi:MAG TPA: hypothetical protein VL854_06840 [Nitrososphaeraceae archaeon]|nr:hypothetical protein [Nitrososphaeraceae archaeon]